MKKIPKILSLLFGIIIISFCSCSKTEVVDNDAYAEFCIPDSLMKNITLDTVKSQNVMSDLKLSGKITFNEDDIIKIFPTVGGHVSDVKVSLGDYVEKGQLLAVLRSSDMANYFNDYKSAQAELTIAKKNLDVVSDLKTSGVSSEKDFLTAQNDYQKALSQFNKVNEVLKINGSAIQPSDSIGSGYFIKAPISGFIVEKNINAGMEVRADVSNNLFTISDLKEVWAVANVYESDIAKIKAGALAEIATLSYPDKKFSGKVERVSNIIDPETKVMSVKIKLSNPDYTIKPGMFANVSILFPENRKMLSVSSASVLFDDNINYVVKFNKRCDVDLEPVNVVKSFNNTSYIQDDSLKEGDLVIARNNLFVFTALMKL